MTTFSNSNSNITNSSYDSSSKISSFNNSSNTFNYSNSTSSNNNNNFNSNLTRQLLAALVEGRSLKSQGCEIPPSTGL